MGQDSDEYEIGTLFGRNSTHASGGYGAISNKFSTLNGSHANLVEIYGGWYVDHWLLIGLGAASVTNDIPVPANLSALPQEKMSYHYSQFGLMTEFTIGSSRAIHASFQLFAGPGFILQYNRYEWDDEDDDFNHRRNTDWLAVVEPGVKLEMNLFRWMRFCPGISYRKVFESSSSGLSDDDLSAPSVNLTLKFGKF